MAEKELTFKDVADHNTKKDLWLVIHDKVYDISKFVDEHPYVVPRPCLHSAPHHPRGHIA